MPGVSYTPGGWLGLAGAGVWLLAELGPDDPAVEACWPLVRDGADLDDIAAPLRAFVGVCRRDGATRAVVQGSGWAELVGVDGQVTTVRPGDTGVELDDRWVAAVRLGGASRPTTAEAQLPIESGVVLAAALTVRLTAAGPAPQPEVRPASSDPRQPPADAWPPQPVPARPVATGARNGEWAADPREGGPGPAVASHRAPDPTDSDPGRYDAMFGFVAPAAAPVEEFPPTAPVPLVRPEPLSVGHTTLRPAARDSRDVIDLADLPWLAPAPPAANPSMPVPPMPVPPMPVPPMPVPPPTAPPAPPTAPPASTPASAVAVPPVPAAPAPMPVVAWMPPVPPVADEPGLDQLDELILTTVRGGRPGGPVPGPPVSAVHCAAGHLNPPDARACRACGTELLAQSSVRVNRPPLGLLRLSSGDTILLDRNVILGRAPGAPTGSGADEPHYVKLPSPYHDVSRRHVEVRLDGWNVVAVDLDSRNGTVVEQPGEEPVQLPRGGSCVLRNGALVGLAEDVSFRFEVTG